MIVILNKNAEQEKVNKLLKEFESMGLSTNYSEGSDTTIIGLIGDTSQVDLDIIKRNEVVDDVRRISEPYKSVNRRFHPEDTHIDVSGVKMGEGYFNVIAGPCSIESSDQMIEVAENVKRMGAKMLRGGAFKPRTSPYAFQGLHEEGIKILIDAKKATGLPVVTEIMSEVHLDLFADVDLIQVGARNMQNFQLLKALGTSDKPILLKRGLANTIEEWLMSAEYIMAGGNKNIILCERGIRTFDNITRNTLDISAIPIIKKLSHLPIIVDPSHATGTTWLVEPLSKASIAVGADGLIIEVHNNPKEALCDGPQSLDFEQFDKVMGIIKDRVKIEDKEI